MRYRRYLAVLLVLLISGAAALKLFQSKPQLIVEGRPMSDWALALGGPGPTEPAKEIFKACGPEAVPDLVRLLRTRDSILARPIKTLSGKLPARVDTRLHRILRINEPPHRRYMAAMALGLMGTNAMPAIPALIEALRDPSINVRVTAALNLARLGSAGLPGLMAALDGPNPSARQAAMIGLAHMGPGAEGATSKLADLLQNPVDRPHARTALQSIGKPAVPTLIELLNHPSEEVRIETISILGHIGVPARAAVPRLLNLVKDRSQRVRFSSINSLGRICGWCDQVISVLQDAFEDESWEVRKMAAAHLSAEQQTAERTVDTLLHKIAEGTSPEKQRAISNLGLMGLAGERAVPSLRALAGGDNHEERELAREALEKIMATTQKRERNF